MKMPYGKYKDWEIEDIPSSYLRWGAENINGPLATVMDKEWQWREKYNEHIEE